MWQTFSRFARRAFNKIYKIIGNVSTDYVQHLLVEDLDIDTEMQMLGFTRLRRKTKKNPTVTYVLTLD